MQKNHKNSGRCVFSPHLLLPVTFTLFLLIVFLAPFPLSAKPNVAGNWSSILGNIRISNEAGKIVGTLVLPSEGVSLKPDTRILEGVMMEDSLSGKIRLDALGCSQEIWGFGVLLLDAAGDVLSGSVNVNAKGCTVQGLTGKNGLYWKRAKNAPKTPKPHKTVKTPKSAETSPVSSPEANEETLPTAAGDSTEETGEEIAVEPENLDELGELKAKYKHKKKFLQGPRPEPGTYDPMAALKLTDKALRLKNEGKALLEAGKFEQARHKFEEALKESPCDPFATNGIGITYYARNMYSEALEAYKKALVCDPNYQDAYYNIGCIYALQDKPDMAMRYLKIALMNGFVETGMMRKDPDLRTLQPIAEFQAMLRGEF